MEDEFDLLHGDLLGDDVNSLIDPNVQLDPGFTQPEDEDEEDEDLSAELMRDPTLGFDNDDEDEDTDNNQEDSLEQSDLINQLLRAKGIEDPAAVKFENEDGELVDVNFYDLSREEQLNILQSTDSDIDFGLNTHEVEVVNFLRENDVTFEQAIDYYKRQAVEEYLKEQSNADFSIDSYTDEELFVLDLKSKYDDLTDDELQLELEKETGHPELFKKKIDRIRKEYVSLEIQEKEAEQQAKLEQEQDKFNVLKDSLVQVATTIEDIGGIDLDVQEKEQILSFVLNKDVNGVSPLLKAMDDPKTLFELAWYATKGKDAFEFVHDYYKKQIESVRKTSYDRGKTEAIKGMPSTANKKAGVRATPATNGTNRSSNVKSIDDLIDI